MYLTTGYCYILQIEIIIMMIRLKISYETRMME